MSEEKKSFGRFAPHIVRTLLGLMFVVFGLNGFLNFMPAPKTMPEPVMNFIMAMQSVHLLTFVSGVQLLVGLLLLLNLFVPLALTLLAPILVGIILFHVGLSPKELGPGIVVTVMELYLAWTYRNAFRPMLALKTRPA